MDLAALVAGVRHVFAGFPFIAPVPDRWLHTTVQMITGGSGSDVEPAQRDELVDRLTTSLADVPPAQLSVGSPLAGASGVIADMDGDIAGQPFHTIYTRVRAVIGAVLGPQALEYDTMPPHLALGYATGPGDSGLVQSALRRRVRPSHALMTVRQVHVLDVIQDAENSVYRWSPVATVPLGTALATTGSVQS